MLAPMTTPTYRLTSPVSTLRRSSGALQVGLDASASALLPGAPAAAESALRAFRGWRSAAEAATLSGVDVSWLSDAVPRLVASGVLTRRTSAPPASGSVVVLGGGRLAHRLVALLADGGVDAFRVADPTPGQPDRDRWRDAAGPARLTFADHWQDALAGPVRLAVVAPPTVEPDRVLTDHLRRARITHLVVRVEPERAVVGPFVVPGRSPCVRCVDLGRRDLDPDWPLLLAQLACTWQEPGELAASWAASSAAAQALAWTDRGVAPPVGVTLELPQDTLALETRSWQAHPACCCVQDW